MDDDINLAAIRHMLRTIPPDDDELQGILTNLGAEAPRPMPQADPVATYHREFPAWGRLVLYLISLYYRSFFA